MQSGRLRRTVRVKWGCVRVVAWTGAGLGVVRGKGASLLNHFQMAADWPARSTCSLQWGVVTCARTNQPVNVRQVPPACPRCLVHCAACFISLLGFCHLVQSRQCWGLVGSRAREEESHMCNSGPAACRPMRRREWHGNRSTGWCQKHAVAGWLATCVPGQQCQHFLQGLHSQWCLPC